ncbi:hydroxyacylglutathione hydrolase [Alkalilimnicola ehrlichii MLHE-1]|uniref:Hydroxyacylglutathione hydrolase n=1 Tax=Alkalilimnicola ehrlichii (strain ATCC BAA-1101 / DSM 17681 / MLHE-1) TaxID=187272 RepID=GLO2_ALKEH|nr:hydroxyacylglutathione hydrolase [Alkalilimnicola ehrlichii]Q0A751.1 RecName: Full=Hydroxyacylglutathione hydrolase; AltName: Full=Glyoxalase II; Short=Glx II [Alkalilimnicola ehrlichii MLHE-1]ABI57336.1 Hydroxyacylglutathione hydrolase [Alkalilimnicola ehrlichii MLHE-1]
MTEIVAIPAFADNYIWLAVDRNRRLAAVVDPGDAEPVEAALRASGLRLSAILITHHHHDHTGGVEELLAAHPVPVYGPADESVPGVSQPLREPDAFEVPGLGLPLRVLDVPGHTAGHIALVADGALFSGDALFAGGCGRLFEGTPEQMYASLGKLAALPEATRVYCGHEYTLANLRFAHQVEPDNPNLTQRLRQAEAARQRGEPTVPSRMADEHATNPFLRAHLPAVRTAAERWSGQTLDEPVAVFAALRRWKDQS